MAKKTFKKMGELAVNKFLSTREQDVENESEIHNVQNIPASNINTTIGNQVKDDKHPDQADKVIDEGAKIKNETKKTQSTRKLTIMLDENLIEYLNIMARLEGTSLTRYLSKIINSDKENNFNIYQNALSILKV